MVGEGWVVGVVKEADPMGGRDVWFVDCAGGWVFRCLVGGWVGGWIFGRWLGD